MHEERSRVALITRAKDIAFGIEPGTLGESGWVKHEYAAVASRGTVVVCMNGALYAAERDLWGGAEHDDYSSFLQTEEGRDAKRLLAETIHEQFPELWKEASGHCVAFNPEREAHTQQLIIAFNDRDETDEEAMRAVFLKAEDRAWSLWLEEHPRPAGSEPLEALLA